jgi:hypothetical protein
MGHASAAQHAVDVHAPGERVVALVPVWPMPPPIGGDAVRDGFVYLLLRRNEVDVGVERAGCHDHFPGDHFRGGADTNSGSTPAMVSGLPAADTMRPSRMPMSPLRSPNDR